MPNRRRDDEPVEVEPGYRGASVLEGYLFNGAKPVDTSQYPGTLICIEGTDSVGRTSHTALLREWLENEGYGVVHSALTRSVLAGEGLRQAKAGHTLGPLTMDLFYATDFADRLETEIIPALLAGFVVLTDRYVYASIARSIVRGSDPDWVEDIYRYAPKPDAVLYLDIDVESLLPRVLVTGGFDYWESGLDFQDERDIFKSFVRYQQRLLQVFDHLAERFNLVKIDANREMAEVFADLKAEVQSVLAKSALRQSPSGRTERD